MKDDTFESWPKGLRWLLFVPMSLGITYIMLEIGSLLPFFNGPIFVAFDIIFFAVFSTYLAVIIVPSDKKVVSYIYLFFYTGMGLMALFNPSYSDFGWAARIGAFLGAIGVYIFIRCWDFDE